MEIMETDGHPQVVEEEADKMAQLAGAHGAREVRTAADDAEADQLAAARRLSERIDALWQDYAAERIRALNYFSDVDVEARDGSTSEQVIVDVNVEEAPTGSFG